MLGNNLSLSLSRLGDEAILPSLSAFLTEDEDLIGNYAAKNVFLTFTTRRILMEIAGRNDSMTHNIYIIPYQSISCCKLKTASDFAYDTYMELTVSGLGCLSLDFSIDCDIHRICKCIN